MKLPDKKYDMKTTELTEFLKLEIIRKNDALDSISNELTELLIYLHSSKFHGFENNYVNAQEMANRILDIKRLIITNY